MASVHYDRRHARPPLATHQNHHHNLAAADDLMADQRSSTDSQSVTSSTHRPHADRPRSSTTAGLSSSFKIPARSYVRRASHGPQDVTYASSGVHEQTAELSSSLLQHSALLHLPSAAAQYDNSNLDLYLSTSRFDHNDRYDFNERFGHSLRDPILETSEPATPDEGSEEYYPQYQPRPARETQHARASLSPVEAHEDEDEDETLEDIESAEESPLLARSLRDSSLKKASSQDTDDILLESQRDYRSRKYNNVSRLLHAYVLAPFDSLRHGTGYRDWDMRQFGRVVILQPISVLPAVFLGLLLNLLDALSYGIILFPLGEEAFSHMGPDGVSMFYVSCIVSQIVYSSGSIFRGGVGSEMIEVVPFFHKMARIITASMGTADPVALRATVITSFAMSSVLTGIVFLILGSAKLGTLVSFFPHSILTGCIGGVGIFLIRTGVEVSVRMEGELKFSLETLNHLISLVAVAQWLPPLALAICLLVVKRFYDRTWLVPAYYVSITAIFYIVVAAVPQLSFPDLRHRGWIFDAPAAGVPWYHFYSYFKFSLVDWKAIWTTIPTQLALAFFGILHVPINVPNLALVAQEDNVSVDRELLLHGVSNLVSGAIGSVQNYLVFVNSVLFMDTGGDCRLAGYLLALATFGLMLSGSATLGYVPVVVVATLIQFLGIDLAVEALWATYGRLHRLEHLTIVVIALVMGMYDFVVGIGLGIGLACLVYVVQTSRKTVIRAEFSGTIAESTVRRPSRQRRYLHKVGPQIRVVKLGGYLFFGSIVKVEKKVRALIDAEAFAAEPIRYLIIEFSAVNGIDYSAAEAFTRMNRILHRRDIRLSLAGVSLTGEIGHSLQMVGLFVEDDAESAVPTPKVYESLNSALESCENELLTILTERQRASLAASHANTNATSIDIPIAVHSPATMAAFRNVTNASPRFNLLQRAATATMEEQQLPDVDRWRNFKQPLPLILQAFQDLTTKNEDFWHRAIGYFCRRLIPRGQALYRSGEAPDGFYILQSGMIRAESDLEQGRYKESIVSGTTCGELPFFSETTGTSTAVAELDCVAWLLTPEKWQVMQEKDPDVASELLKVGMKLSAERLSAITSYVLITAS